LRRVTAFARRVDDQQYIPLELAERDRLILQVHEFVIKDRGASRLRRDACRRSSQYREGGDDQCVDRSDDHIFLLSLVSTTVFTQRMSFPEFSRIPVIQSRGLDPVSSAANRAKRFFIRSI